MTEILLSCAIIALLTACGRTPTAPETACPRRTAATADTVISVARNAAGDSVTFALVIASREPCR